MSQSKRGRMRRRRDRENRKAISVRAKRTNNSGVDVPTSTQERRAGGGGGLFGWAANLLPSGNNESVEEEDEKLAELRNRRDQLYTEMMAAETKESYDAPKAQYDTLSREITELEGSQV